MALMITTKSLRVIAGTAQRAVLGGCLLKGGTRPYRSSLGLDLSTATRIFFLQSLRCHGLPFPLRADEPNAVTLAAMEEAERDDDMYGPFDSVEEMMKSLNS